VFLYLVLVVGCVGAHNVFAFLNLLFQSFFLDGVACVIEVTEQDCQEQIKHHKHSNDHKQNELEQCELVGGSRTVVHDVDPVLSGEDLEDCTQCIAEVVEVLYRVFPS